MLIFWIIIKTYFHCRDLIRLNLGRNRLDTIPYAALRNLNHLQILEMSDNQISTAAMTPNGFKGNYLHSTYSYVVRCFPTSESGYMTRSIR